MVVPNPRFVARNGARRLDARDQTRSSQRPQYVVDGPVEHLAENLTRNTEDRVRVVVRMLAHRGQHRHPGTRHTQINLPQQLLNIQIVDPSRVCPPFFRNHSGTQAAAPDPDFPGTHAT